MSFSHSIRRGAALLIGAFLLSDCESSKKTATQNEVLNSIDKGIIEVPDEFAVSKERVGLLKIDMPIEKIYSYYDKAKIKKLPYTSEGQTFEGYFIKTSKDTSRYLRIDPICADSCKIWRINVFDKRYKTRSGLGIGSSVREIKSYHFIDWAGNTEEGPAFGLERLGITFLLDSTTIPPYLSGNIELESLPDSAKVSGIIVTKGLSR